MTLERSWLLKNMQISQSKAKSCGKRVAPSSTFYYLACDSDETCRCVQCPLPAHAHSHGWRTNQHCCDLLYVSVPYVPITKGILHAPRRAGVQFQHGFTWREAFICMLKVYENVPSTNVLCRCAWKVSQFKKCQCCVRGPELWHFTTLFRSRACI